MAKNDPPSPLVKQWISTRWSYIDGCFERRFVYSTYVWHMHIHFRHILELHFGGIVGSHRQNCGRLPQRKICGHLPHRQNSDFRHTNKNMIICLQKKGFVLLKDKIVFICSQTDHREKCVHLLTSSTYRHNMVVCSMATVWSSTQRQKCVHLLTEKSVGICSQKKS